MIYENKEDLGKQLDQNAHNFIFAKAQDSEETVLCELVPVQRAWKKNAYLAASDILCEGCRSDIKRFSRILGFELQ